MRAMKRGSSGSKKGGGGVKACSLTFDSAWQAQSIPSQLNPAQPNPTQARPKNL